MIELSSSQLELLRQQQTDYLPRKDILQQLGSVSALLFVGPAGVGKSTTLDMISQIDARFGRTGSIGTRPAAARDKAGFYTPLTPEEMITKIAEKEVVQYAVHPTTGILYGTAPEMYQKPYNMLEALPVAVEDFRRLAFKETLVFYMVTEPGAWKEWFEARYPEKTDERKKRAEEAMASLAWALSQPQDTLLWVKNLPGKQAQTATMCIQLATHHALPTDGRHEAQAMLATAQRM